MSETKTKLLKSFDGDGYVLETSIVIYPGAVWPYLHLVMNSGNHMSRLEINPRDIDEVLKLLTHGATALKKANEKARVAYTKGKKP